MARILICDDDDAVREVIQAALSETGHAIDAARDGMEAMEFVKKNKYDLLILDRNMPRLNGLQVLQLLRASPATKTLKVLMCTSAGMIGEVDEAFGAGADDYIVKPIDLDRLIKKVVKHVPAGA